jgi:ribonuclease J
MSDSTNVFQAGSTPSESICRDGLREAFRKTKGKLLVATFSSNVHRIQALLDLAYEEGRKVVLLGRSLDRVVTLARGLRRLALPDDLFVDAKDAPQYPASELLVLCTGSQGEPMSALSRLLRGEVKGLKVAEGDRLVLSSRPIPGNEVSIARLLDTAARQGAETSLEGLGPVHVTGHAHREDLAELIRTVRPQHMVPVHGTFRNLQAHGRLAETLGYPKGRISLLDGGQCLRIFTSGKVEMAGSVPVGRCYVDEGVDHAVDARVVRDRLILQEDGVIFATLQVDFRSGELVAEPMVLSRGFVVLSDDTDYNELLRNVARKAFEDAPPEVRKDQEALKDLLRQALRRVVRKTTQTRPMVVPVLLDAG